MILKRPGASFSRLRSRRAPCSGSSSSVSRISSAPTKGAGRSARATSSREDRTSFWVSRRRRWARPPEYRFFFPGSCPRWCASSAPRNGRCACRRRSSGSSARWCSSASSGAAGASPRGTSWAPSRPCFPRSSPRPVRPPWSPRSSRWASPASSSASGRSRRTFRSRAPFRASSSASGSSRRATPSGST